MKTIVSIMSEQTIPNFLFIKEFFENGDDLIFIASKKFEERINWIEKALHMQANERIILSDEENRVAIEKDLWSKLKSGSKYLVNLTGGTKYMSLSIYSIFNDFGNSEFYYIPLPKNIVLPLDKGRTDIIPLKYRLNIEEYFQLHNVKIIRDKRPIRQKDEAQNFLQKFLSDDNFKNVFNDLRPFRDLQDNISIKAVKNLSSILEDFSFTTSDPNNISAEEIQYLTGGWFEEFVYFAMFDLAQGNISLNMKIREKLGNMSQELDVVFIRNNKLFVIECKTGLKSDDRNEELKKVIDKASSIKNFFGISCDHKIFSLNKQLPNNYDVSYAKSRGISYYSADYFSDPQKFQTIISEIISDEGK